jgi:hypothetical protein
VHRRKWRVREGRTIERKKKNAIMKRKQLTNDTKMRIVRGPGGGGGVIMTSLGV